MVSACQRAPVLVLRLPCDTTLLPQHASPRPFRNARPPYHSPANHSYRPARQITPYRAGHVIGAAMFMVEIAGLRCLYTGDYSRLADRHLPAADTPPVQPHIGGWRRR